MNWWHAPFSQSRLVAFPIPLDDPSMSPTSHQLHHRKAFWLRNCTSSLGYLWLFGVSTIETQNFGVHFETKLNEFARWFGRNLRTTDVCEFWGASRCLVPNFNQYTFLETTVLPSIGVAWSFAENSGFDQWFLFMFVLAIQKYPKTLAIYILRIYIYILSIYILHIYIVYSLVGAYHPQLTQLCCQGQIHALQETWIAWNPLACPAQDRVENHFKNGHNLGG